MEQAKLSELASTLKALSDTEHNSTEKSSSGARNYFNSLNKIMTAKKTTESPDGTKVTEEITVQTEGE